MVKSKKRTYQIAVRVNKHPLPPDSTAKKIITVSSLELLKTKGDLELSRADIICVDGDLISEQNIHYLYDYTHEKGEVFTSPKTDVVGASQNKFSKVRGAKGLFAKVLPFEPKEYGEEYIERWDGVDFMANSKMAAEQILRHFPKTPSKSSIKVLDVGCLNGYIMESLHRAGVKHMYGTDISYTLAVQHLINPDLLPNIRVGDFANNTYPTGAFDVTICMEVLEHLDPKQSKKFIAELVRVTAKDGVLLVSTSEDWNADATHINCRSRAEWRALFAKYGYVESGDQTIFPGFNSFVFKKASATQALKSRIKSLGRMAVYGKLQNPANNGGKPKKTWRTHLKAVRDKVRAVKRERSYKPVSSYSQSGEDLIIDFIFKAIGVTKPTYLDIGAHHPRYINNTALFYEKGCRGINIEPDPALFSRFEKLRPQDTNLNIGIGAKAGKATFYLMAPSTLNTFSKEEAETYVTKHGYSIQQEITSKIRTVNQIVKEYCDGIFPDLLSLDVEGLDYEVITSINFKKHAPKVICVETISYSATGNGVKDKKLIDYVKKQGYYLYADTNINSIFVKESLWKR